VLTPLQSTVSRQIYEAVKEFPKAVSELISTYHTDEEIIQRALDRTRLMFDVRRMGQNDDLGDLRYQDIFKDKFDLFLRGSGKEARDAPFVCSFGQGFYWLLEDSGGRSFCYAVKYCLSSSECDPAIKVAVIRNVISCNHFIYNSDNQNVLPTGLGVGVMVMNVLLDQMRNEAQPINLDCADFSGLSTCQSVNFDGISAVGAKFCGANFRSASFRNARLSGADFSDANLDSGRFDGADMSDAILHRTCLAFAKLRQVNLTSAKFNQTILSRSGWIGTDVTGLITSDLALKKFLRGYCKYPYEAILVKGDVRLSVVRKVKSGSKCVIS